MKILILNNIALRKSHTKYKYLYLYAVQYIYTNYLLIKLNPLYKHRHTLQCNTYIHNDYTSLDILYKENGSNVDPICFSKNKQTKKRKRKNFPHFWTFEVVENFGWETRLNINNFLVIKKYTIFKVDNAENVLHAKRSLKRLEP